jgi:hypothetical protein
MHRVYRNVNEALYSLPRAIAANAISEDSRNGKVLSFPHPLILTTESPKERVCLCPIRRANPFLFLLDGLSILSSLNPVKPLADIAPRMAEFSDNGVHIRGHYGQRLHDQIPLAIEMLKANHENRRVTMAIWRLDDLGADSKDIPCNVHVNLRIVRGALDLTVFNRSNDLFWGMLGANIVQFSFLQEFIAASVGVPVGYLHQVSTNVHIYTEFGPGKRGLEFTYPTGFYPKVISLDPAFLQEDLDELFQALADDADLPVPDNQFVARVVNPMLRSWKAKNTDVLDSLDYDCDWFRAARMYFRKKEI